MTHEEFNKLQLEIFDDILKMAKTKGIEYSSNKTERLANFKRLAAELEIPATKVGYIFFKKHLDSITTFLKDGRVYSDEGIRGRFVDVINYLTLIYGLIVDELSLNGKQNPELAPSNLNQFGESSIDRFPNELQPNELKPELILEKGIFTGKDVFTGRDVNYIPLCIYCREMITLNDNYIKTSNYYAHRICYEKDLARIEKRKQAKANETSAKKETKTENK